jgi:hypothetical protein
MNQLVGFVSGILLGIHINFYIKKEDIDIIKKYCKKNN